MVFKIKMFLMVFMVYGFMFSLYEVNNSLKTRLHEVHCISVLLLGGRS